MDALIGLAVLIAFSLGIFVAVPFVIAPFVLGGMLLQRRRQADAAPGATSRATSTVAARPVQDRRQDAVAAAA